MKHSWPDQIKGLQMWLIIYVAAFRMLQYAALPQGWLCQCTELHESARWCSSGSSREGGGGVEGLQLGNDAWSRSSPLGFAHSLRPPTNSSSSILKVLICSRETVEQTRLIFLVVVVEQHNFIQAGRVKCLALSRFHTSLLFLRQTWWTDGELNLVSFVVFATFVLSREQELLWQGTIKESGLCAILKISEQKFGDGLHRQMDLGPGRIVKIKLKFYLVPFYLTLEILLRTYQKIHHNGDYWSKLNNALWVKQWKLGIKSPQK